MTDLHTKDWLFYLLVVYSTASASLSQLSYKDIWLVSRFLKNAEIFRDLCFLTTQVTAHWRANINKPLYDKPLTFKPIAAFVTYRHR